MCLSLISAHGAVTITSARVEGFNDSEDTAIVNGGILGLFVVDSGGDGFGTIQEGSTIAIDSMLGDGNDIVLNIVESFAPDEFDSARISGVGDNTLQVEIEGLVSTGDQFAVYWFPTLSISDNVFTVGDTYGIAREANWVLPADGTSTAGPTTVLNAGRADQIVRAIPEPSSVALLGLGAVGLISRRRRD